MVIGLQVHSFTFMPWELHHSQRPAWMEKSWISPILHPKPHAYGSAPTWHCQMCSGRAEEQSPSEMVLRAKAEGPRSWWFSHPPGKLKQDTVGIRTWLCGWCYHVHPGFLRYRVRIHRLLVKYRAQLMRGREEHLWAPTCRPSEEDCKPGWREPRHVDKCRPCKPKIGHNAKRGVLRIEF